MRHGMHGRKLNRTASHRKAMFSNMANALIKHEQIKTAMATARRWRSSNWSTATSTPRARTPDRFRRSRRKGKRHKPFSTPEIEAEQTARQTAPWRTWCRSVFLIRDQRAAGFHGVSCGPTLMASRPGQTGPSANVSSR